MRILFNPTTLTILGTVPIINLVKRFSRGFHRPTVLEGFLRFRTLALLTLMLGPLGLSGAHAAAHAAPAATPKRLSARDAEAKALLGRMTLEEKIGQMIQLEHGSLIEEADIEKYFMGSLLAGGNGDPKSNSLQDWTDMYDRYQAHTEKTRLKIPLLFGVDALHGHNNVVGAVVFPHNIGLGASRDAALVEEIGRVTAEEVRATGIQWSFAPCLAVVKDQRWGRTYESFSEDSQVVAELGAAAVRGLQGANLSDPHHVLATSKHLAGDGGTTYGTGRAAPGAKIGLLDEGDTRLSEEELKRVHMPAYTTTFEAGAASVMASFNSWNGVKCSANRRLLTDILKTEMGFEGFVISDYDSLNQIPGDHKSQIRDSINAGMDMVMMSNRYREFAAELKELVDAKEVPISRVDDAVLRILRVKLAMGLLDEGRSQLADRSLQKTFGSSEHRELARRAVRESLVLLKNEHATLPLSRTAKRIHVAGRNADNLGNQCGGWTIDWQGLTGPATTGTTILNALRSTAPKDMKVTFSEDGSGAAGADVGVVVIGEKPYAEFFGDRDMLNLSPEDVAAVAAVKKAGIPVVVVLVSGRPLPLGDVATTADAIVAAWLPGSEGQGLVDVLFGDYKPTGKLSFTWPRTSAVGAAPTGQSSKDPLFPFGFGLTY
jgi:beta-glucosidase